MTSSRKRSREGSETGGHFRASTMMRPRSAARCPPVSPRHVVGFLIAFVLLVNVFMWAFWSSARPGKTATGPHAMATSVVSQTCAVASFPDSATLLDWPCIEPGGRHASRAECARVGCCWREADSTCHFPAALVAPASSHPSVSAAVSSAFLARTGGSAGLRDSPYSIAFLVVALGRYRSLVTDLIESLDAFFCKPSGSDAPRAAPLTWKVILFTSDDDSIVPRRLADRVHVVQIRQRGWPHDSMQRPAVYLEHAELWEDADSVVSLDADLTLTAPVCAAWLVPSFAAHVSWWYASPIQDWTLERREASAARVRDEEAPAYLTGAIWGGSTEWFKGACEQLRARINKDARADVVAVWHDESHLNRLFADSWPTLILPPTFVWPEPPLDLWLVRHRNPLRYFDTMTRHRIAPIRVLHRAKDPEVLRRLGVAPTDSADPLDQMYSLLTVGVHTYERPGCIERMVYELLAKYPLLRVLIVDDSTKPQLDPYFVAANPRVRVIATEPDIGLSAARNLLVRSCETPLFLLMDDDFVPTKDMDLPRMVQLMQKSNVDILGGSVFGESSSFFIQSTGPWMSRSLTNVTISEAIPPYDAGSGHEDAKQKNSARRIPGSDPDDSCFFVDMVSNFFIARTAALKDAPWTDVLKVGEHEDFFFMAQKKGLRVGTCQTPRFEILNLHFCSLPWHTRKFYAAQRSRQFVNYWPITFKKWGIDRMKTPGGLYIGEWDATGNVQVRTQRKAWHEAGAWLAKNAEWIKVLNSTSAFSHRMARAIVFDSYTYATISDVNLVRTIFSNEFELSVDYFPLLPYGPIATMWDLRTHTSNVLALELHGDVVQCVYQRSPGSYIVIRTPFPNSRLERWNTVTFSSLRDSVRLCVEEECQTLPAGPLGAPQSVRPLNIGVGVADSWPVHLAQGLVRYVRLRSLTGSEDLEFDLSVLEKGGQFVSKLRSGVLAVKADEMAGEFAVAAIDMI